LILSVVAEREISVTLYEQFLAVGSVKSLLTGKEISASPPYEKSAQTKEQQEPYSSQTDTADFQAPLNNI